MSDKYYIYIHINPVKNEIFYIGKGYGKRAYDRNCRNNHWYNTVNKYDYDVIIINENLTEIDAYELEKKYIKTFGRRDLGLGTLVNLSDGGEGVVNPSVDVRFKMGNSNRGKEKSLDVKNKISKSLKGNIPWNKGNKKDKELIKQYQKEYYKANKDKINAYQNEYKKRLK